MTCQEIRELFSARVDEALSAEESAHVDAHLATCAECAREWDRFAQTVGLLRAVAPARAPVGFVDRVLAARPRPWYQRLARGLFLPWPVKVPLEAAAVVMVAGLAILIFQRSPELQQAARAPAPTVAVPAPSVPTTPATPSAPATPAEPMTTAAPPAPPERPRELRLPDETKSRDARQGPAEARREAAVPARDAAPEPEPPRAVAESRAKSVEPPPAVGGLRSNVEQDAASRAAPRAAAPSATKAGEVQKLAALRSDGLARLAVTDRAAGERAVRELVAQAGGEVVTRAEEAEATVFTLIVPGERWDELQRGLRGLGPLYLERSRAGADGVLRITLRLER